MGTGHGAAQNGVADGHAAVAVDGFDWVDELVAVTVLDAVFGSASAPPNAASRLRIGALLAIALSLSA